MASSIHRIAAGVLGLSMAFASVGSAFASNNDGADYVPFAAIAPYASSPDSGHFNALPAPANPAALNSAQIADLFAMGGAPSL